MHKIFPIEFILYYVKYFLMLLSMIHEYYYILCTFLTQREREGRKEREKVRERKREREGEKERALLFTFRGVSLSFPPPPLSPCYYSHGETRAKKSRITIRAQYLSKNVIFLCDYYSHSLIDAIHQFLWFFSVTIRKRSGAGASRNNEYSSNTYFIRYIHMDIISNRSDSNCKLLFYCNICYLRVIMVYYLLATNVTSSCASK